MGAAGSIESGPVAGSASRPRRVDGAAVAVVAIALGGLALRLVLFTRPIAVIDRLFVPDDTYYTLTIARSLAEGLGPTVDGSTLTSGFQPLLGFLMVPVFWLTDAPDAALRIDLLFLVLVDTLTIGMLAWVAGRLAGRVAAVVAAAIWAVSPVAISMALGGLETSLAILLQVSLVAIWIHAASRDDRRSWIAVGVVAALAVLARIDALALVGLLAAIQLWRGPRRFLVAAAIAGASVLGPWWIWCTVTFGSPVPTSGAAVHELAPFGSFTRETMTLAAGAVVGGPFGVWDRARSLLIDRWLLGAVVFWAFVFVLVALTGALLRRHPATGGVDARDRPIAWMLVPALPAFAACLLTFYAWFGVTWFFTRYLAPVAWILTVLIAVGSAALVRRVPVAPVRVAVGVALSIALLAALSVDAGWTSAETRTPVAGRTGGAFDALTGYREPVQEVLRAVPPGSTLAGWQSGALGYYGIDRTVINLDGAVNPDMAGATPESRARYLRRRNVDGVADFELVVVGLRLALARLRPAPLVQDQKVAPAQGVLPPYVYATVDWPGDR